MKNKGFTLGELLIVVAIISVLVAISMPLFSGILEKKREESDVSDVRAKYASVMAKVLNEDYDGTACVVNLQQKSDGWEIETPIEIGDIVSGADGGDNDDGSWLGKPSGNGQCLVWYDEAKKSIILDWDGSYTPSIVTPTPTTITPVLPTPTITPTPTDDVTISPTPAVTGGTTPEAGDSPAMDVLVFPDVEDIGDFTIEQGNIYYSDGNYIAWWTTPSYSYNQYYQSTPDVIPEGYCKITSETPVWIMKRDSKGELETSVLTDLVAGLIVKDGDDYYIRTSNATNGQPPTIDTSGNWVKINTTINIGYFNNVSYK